MNLILRLIAILVLVATGSAQEKEKTESSRLIQLFPVTTKENPDRRMYSFEHAVKTLNSDNFSSGWYVPTAVIDFHDVAFVEIDTVESAAAPFRGISVGFTEGGYKKLGDYLKGAEPRELVLALDGHTYSVLDMATLNGMAKSKGNFIVFIAEPYSDMGNHLVTLLVDKLRAHLPKSKGNQGGADQVVDLDLEPEGGPKQKPKSDVRPR